MIYFISGHRDLTQEEFDANYAPAIEDAIDNGQTTWEDCEFIVGDCKGCDQMAAEYIAKYIEENMDEWDCVPCTLTIHHMISEYTKRGKTGFILKTDYRTCLPYFVK